MTTRCKFYYASQLHRHNQNLCHKIKGKLFTHYVNYDQVTSVPNSYFVCEGYDTEIEYNPELIALHNQRHNDIWIEREQE